MAERDHDRSDGAARIDPDLGPRRHPLASAGLVALGGAVGTAARALLGAAIPDAAGVPFGILVINLAGAFVLGLLLAVLQRLGPDVGRRQVVRLLGGTGVLGGFTTYSALATDTVLLIDGGDLPRGLGYAVITVVAGALLSWAGIVCGRAVPVPLGRDREAS
jgi:CrcB protein